MIPCRTDFSQCFQKGSLESVIVSKMNGASNAGDHPDISNLGNNMRHREVGNHLLLTLFQTIGGNSTGTGPGYIILKGSLINEFYLY